LTEGYLNRISPDQQVTFVGTTMTTNADFYLLIAETTEFLAETLPAKLQILKDEYLPGKAAWKLELYEVGSRLVEQYANVNYTRTGIYQGRTAATSL
jgi:hypothetical protein